jgi:DNA-binding response OmpR family regulator
VSDRQTLLIVEDDPNLARMLAEYFDVQGFGVRTAEWGLDAVYACWENPPHLAILDIHLPDINGYDIARRLHAHRRTRDIPLIFLTSRRGREDRLQGLQLGAVDYIAKPFDLQELLLRVRNALRRQQNASQVLFDPITRLPEGALVDEHLDELLTRRDWAVIAVGLHNLDRFREAYGFVAADDVLLAVSLRLRQAVEDADARVDFLGQLEPARFIIVTRPAYVSEFQRAFQAKLGQPLDYFYPLEDRPEALDAGQHLALRAGVVTATMPPPGSRSALRRALLDVCQ